jgi:hypothetical protein
MVRKGGKMKKGTKEILKQAGFAKAVESVEHGFCPTCGKPISYSDFRDELSRKEYQISGMCKDCQFLTFGG